MKTDRKLSVIILGKFIPPSGKTHQNQEIYHTGGVICTIKATSYKDPPKVLVIRGGNTHEQEVLHRTNSTEGQRLQQEK